MKFQSLLLGLALVFTTALAHAGTVSVSTVGGSLIVNKDGLVLKNGYAVRVGSFNLPDATRDHTLAAVSDYSQLKSWFKPLGEGIAGAGTVSQANGSGTMLRVNGVPTTGNVFGTITGISDTYMAPGTPLYLWVFDDANPDNADQWGIFSGAKWLAPQSIGSQTLASNPLITALQGKATTTQLFLTVPKPCYGNWTRGFAAGTSAAQMAATADPMGDGIANLAKYAWGMNPNSHGKTPTSMTGSGSGAKFTFLSPRTLSDVQVSAECSTDLKTWSPAAAVVVSSDSSFDTCQCSVPTGAHRCFWRVRVAALAVQ